MLALRKQIEVWLAANAPEILNSLQPGATEEEIAGTEAFLGLSFPEDVKGSYRIHNGQVPESQRLFGNWELLSLDGMRFE